MFYINQKLPFAGNVSYREITNAQFFDLLKYINNDDDRGVADYFDSLISSNLESPQLLTNLEKFLILLDIRSVCIGDHVDIKVVEGSTARLSLLHIIESIKSSITDIQFSTSISIGEVVLNLKLPSKLYTEPSSEIYEDVIESVTTDSNTHRLNSFTIDEKQEFFKSLPSSVYIEVASFVKNIHIKLSECSVIHGNANLGINRVPLSVFDNTMYAILKMLYKEDLMNFYELQYSIIKRLQFSYDHFMQMTPNESKLFINLYHRDVQAQENAQKQNSNSFNGPVPAFATV